MNFYKNIVRIFLIVMISSIGASAQNAAKCFQTDALKGLQIVRFTQTGEKIAGTFEYENGESELAPVYQFTGTRTGNVLKIKFADGKMPDVTPSEMRNTNWRIETSGAAEVLRIGFYGRDYRSNKFANYIADFEPCEPDYQTLAVSAGRIVFPKGKNSAGVRISLKNQSDRKAFRLGARKNQTISIQSPGCAISFYYPNKNFYEEAKAIDVLTLEKIRQTGDYLFVFSLAGAANGICPTEFKITD